MSTPREQRRGGPPNGEAGFALVMVVIFSVLVFVLVSELVVTARMARSTGQNDALMARMNNQMVHTQTEVEQLLLEDLDGGDEAPIPDGEEAGGGGIMGGGGGGGGGEEEEEAPPSDSSNDPWFEPTAYADGELTTYVWVEDENRKFNVLSLASPEPDFADESKDQLIRLITAMRERTLFEVSNSDATSIANSIIEWLEGNGRQDQNLPKPELKSSEEMDDKIIPLHLDELLLLRGVTEDVYYDLILEGPPLQVLPGLQSVLTIYTSYRTDPGDPEKNQRLGREMSQEQEAEALGNIGDGAGSVEGIGVRINVNTASRAVLRGLMPEAQISNSVLEALLRYRNEEAEIEEDEEIDEAIDSYSGDVEEGLEPPKQFFESLADLEEVPEFANLADEEVKDRFLDLLTTESDVFSIHLTCVFKRDEERKVFVMTQRRSIVVRLPGDDGSRLYPIVRLERTRGRRVMAVDFPEEEEENQRLLTDDMDQFSLEERKWNPFYVEFYEQSDEFLNSRGVRR